jgi:hypothetical protein
MVTCSLLIQDIFHHLFYHLIVCWVGAKLMIQNEVTKTCYTSVKSNSPEIIDNVNCEVD